MRTFIQNAVETLCAEILGDLHAVFLLPAPIVEGEILLQDLVELGRRFFLDILGRKYVFHFRGNLDLAALEIVIERIARERSERADHDDGNAEKLQTTAERFGKRRRGSVKAVARLRIHEHGVAELFDRVRHVAEQMQVGREFIGGNTADGVHEPVLADKAIGRTNNIKRSGIKDRCRNLQIDEAAMVHQIEAGLLFTKLLHTDLLAGEVRRRQIGNGYHAKQRTEKHIRTDRLAVLGLGHCHNLVVALGNGL